MPFVKAVVWEDEEEKNWKVKKVPSKTVGSFELNGKTLKMTLLWNLSIVVGILQLLKMKKLWLSICLKNI